jgi:tetratricopeptide (TPR) repeat protein
MPTSSLDNEELFRIAVMDMKAGRHEEAIDRLKRLIERAPDNANAHCLLGAEHAELGLFDRAIGEFEHAIALAPSLAVARFQLGLIHFIRNDVQQAERLWSELDGLPDSAALDAFSKALLLTTSGNFKSALAEVQRGLAANPSEALARDMTRIKTQIENQLLNRKAEPDAKSAAEGKHALLSSYSELSQTPGPRRPVQ